MKKIFFLLGLFLSTVLAEAHPGSMQKKLTMPEKIYAVAGIECNLYFRQVFMTINPANFAFYVKCTHGNDYTTFAISRSDAIHFPMQAARGGRPLVTH